MQREFADIRARRKAEKANNAPKREKSPVPGRKNVGVAAACHHECRPLSFPIDTGKKKTTVCQCDNDSLASTLSSSLGELEEIIYGNDENLCQACFDAGGEEDNCS